MCVVTNDGIVGIAMAVYRSTVGVKLKTGQKFSEGVREMED